MSKRLFSCLEECGDSTENRKKKAPANLSSGASYTELPV